MCDIRSALTDHLVLSKKKKLCTLGRNPAGTPDHLYYYGGYQYIWR